MHGWRSATGASIPADTIAGADDAAWPEEFQNFCGAIHEYAESIGKDNFLLLGEVTGGTDMARDYLEIFGRNIDAALDIGDPARRLTDFVKGFVPATEFFDLYRRHDALGSHRETGSLSRVGLGRSRHGCSQQASLRSRQRAGHPIRASGPRRRRAADQLGIPCVYYGTEQAFDGDEVLHDPLVDEGFEDRYIREAMFGGSFGAFRTQGCHFFDLDHPTYLRIAALARLRQRRDEVGPALRRGRIYPRETAFDGHPYAFPDAGQLAGRPRHRDRRCRPVSCAHRSRTGRHVRAGPNHWDKRRSSIEVARL